MLLLQTAQYLAFRPPQTLVQRGLGGNHVQATFNGYWGNINIDFATEREQNFG
jgi:hypothetical protein